MPNKKSFFEQCLDKSNEFKPFVATTIKKISKGLEDGTVTIRKPVEFVTRNKSD